MSEVPRGYEKVHGYAKKVSKKSRYPIENFGRLVAALGGEDAEFEYEGRPQKLGHVRRQLPEGFFPVDSEQDLIAKISYLEGRTRPEEEMHRPGKREERPPNDAGQPNIPDEGKGRPGGIPAIHGHGRAREADEE